MKRIFLIGSLICSAFIAYSQADSVNSPESTRKARTISQSAPLPIQKILADTVESQRTDSIIQKDSLQTYPYYTDSLLADSNRKASVLVNLKNNMDTTTYEKFATHPFLPLHKPAIFMIIDYRKPIAKDELFYLMVGIVFILAFIRVAFSKYFKNLFLLFFQSSLRQKQTREQLLQDNLASLLANLLFVISTGLYICMLIRYKNWIDMSFWGLALICSATLLVTYIAKYLFLLFAGWVFNAKEATTVYIFVVFMVNKVLGILIIPFLIILTFSEKLIVEITINLSIGLVIILLIYRYWISYGSIRSKLKVNELHFFLYLCAIELLPLVLIYKVLINYFAGSF